MTVTPYRRRALLTSAVSVAALLLAACSGTAGSSSPGDTSTGAAYKLSTSTPQPVADIDSFTWSVYAEPLSLAYPYAFDYPPNQILSNVCESLLRWNADLSISPGLASAVANPDPTTWVYTIRDGVTFHDGSALTADDVVASLNLHLNPKVGSYWASVFRNVKSIDKTGPMEVTVTLTQPDSMFNQYMAVSPGTIESKAFLEKAGADYGNPSTGVDCTGPFAFDSWKSGQSITLKRYDNYWDPELRARAGSVKFVFIQDPTTRVNAWQQGEVDGGWQVPSNAYAPLQNGGPGTLYYGLNTTVVSQIVSNLKGPLGDPKVRQALLMAIDREGIIKAGESGVADLADSLVTKNTWGGVSSDQVDSIYADLPRYPYDVDKAKAMAAEAGVSGQKIVIATSPVAVSADVVAQATAQAAKDIGLVPQIKTISPDQYTAMFSDAAARKGFDLFFTAWYVSLADPMEMYGVLRTGEFSNYGKWSDASFDADTGTAIADPVGDPARVTAEAAAQQTAMEQLPWLPLYSPPTSLWLGDRITGVVPSIYYMYYPWAATIGAKG
ncbi:MAG: ABC transporter substrate-binding protein [Nocardioidaceae bacterium]